MSWPSEPWLERPCPRRSWAMARNPRLRKNSICVSQSSDDSGQPWLKTTGWPAPPILVENLGAVLDDDRGHALSLPEIKSNWAAVSRVALDAPTSFASAARGLEQEPGAPLGFIDPVFQQACARHVAVLVAEVVDLPHARGELLVVVAKLGQHVLGRHVIGVIVQDTLQAADVSDGPQGGAADLANALGNVIGGGEDLVALLIQQQVIVAEVRT